MNFRSILILGMLLLSVQVYSQRRADIGIRFNTAEYSRIQLEFRKPVGEFSFLRLGLSLGNTSQYPRHDVFAANDSVVTIRQKDQFGNHYDLRFGLERRISYDWLTFHADLICAYSDITNRNWSYYHVLDSAGTNWNLTQQDPYGSTTSTTTTAVTSFISGGLALGLSFNFSVTENFMLSFTGNYTGMLRFAIAQNESNDLFDEFEYSSYSIYELYPSAGIGLRYVFTPKAEEPVPGN